MESPCRNHGELKSMGGSEALPVIHGKWHQTMAGAESTLRHGYYVALIVAQPQQDTKHKSLTKAQ
jgi:hypothetical protein